MEGIRIAARSSSIAARDQGLDALSVSSKLGVANLVEGSLRRQGNRLRVSVQLIEGASGLAIWSETYERGPNELLNVQQAIAERVVQQVLPEAATEIAEPATRDSTANELMLLARHYEQRVRDSQVVDVDTLREAVRLYREATEADPNSALAHARLAGALLYLGDVDAAEAPVFRALSLNPKLSEVQNTLGEFYWARGLPEAETAFARAVELNRNDADALNNYANSLMLGYEPKIAFEKLGELYRRALELDPLSLSRHASLGDYLGKGGQTEDVRAVIRGVEELFDDAKSYRLIAWLKQLIGEIDQAIAWTMRARDLEPNNPDHRAKLAELYVLIGDYETAQRLEPDPGVGLMFLMRRYEELIDVAEFLMIERPGDMEVRYLLAFAYNATGQFESAIHVLSTTGLPDSAIENALRSVAELEAFFTLINSLAAVDTAETVELAQSLAAWNLGASWWGDIYWVSVHRGCNLAILERHEEALQQLARVMESRQMQWGPLIHDSFCFQQYRQEPVYQDAIRFLEDRQAELRERLPATLEAFGVEL
jgi:tetratricopeptide (TPR) repeat protein